jgi:hypothetical protein
MMMAYGYDAPQDLMEDFQWHVRDNKIKCQHCNATLDINQYWPDCGPDCRNYSDGEHLEARVDDPEFQFEPETADDINEDWFELVDEPETKMEQQELFGKEK